MTEPQQTTWKGTSLALLLLTTLGLLVIAPLALLMRSGIPGSAGEMDALRGLLLDPTLLRSILRTLAVALLACGLASVIAIPAALIAVRCNRPVPVLIQLLGLLPLGMPPFVGAAMLKQFGATFNQTGHARSFSEIRIEGNELALVLVFALHFMPLILFSLVAGLRGIDRGLAESARTLGGSGLLVWRRITLPLATPAYIAGASLMLLKILEDLGTPLILGIDDMLAPQLLLRLGSAGLSDPALNLGALLLFGGSLLVVSLAWSTLLPPLGPEAPDRGQCPLRWRAGPGARLAATVLTVMLGALVLTPYLWLLVTSLGASWSGKLSPDAYSLVHYRKLSVDTLSQLPGTLTYAAAAGMLALVLGGAFGALTSRPGTLARVMRFAATAMFAIPGVVLALGYLNAQKMIGGDLAAWPAFGWLALLLVVVFKQLPFSQRLMAGCLRALPDGRLDSARSLGSTTFGAHLHITLPALGGVLVTIFLLGFVAAATELSAALLLLHDPQASFAQHLFRTLQVPPLAGLGAAQGLLLTGLAGSGLLVALVLLRRRAQVSAAAAGLDRKAEDVL